MSRSLKYPPGPKRKPFVGHLLSYRRDPIGFLTRMANTYGDIVSFTVGSQRVILLSHPDYIKQVLVKDHRNFVKGRSMERAKRLLGEGLLTSEGDFHLRQRRLIQPAFQRERITAYGAVMAEHAARMRWQDGGTVDIEKEMTRLTLAIVGKALLGTDGGGGGR